MLTDDQVKIRLLTVYPLFDTVYGPYDNPHVGGRRHVVLYSSVSGKRMTMSWARAKITAKIKKRLSDTVDVDHRDSNYTNDSWDNLQVLSQKDNIKKAVADGIIIPPVQTIETRLASSERWCGEKNINAVFTDEIVVYLRRLHKLNQLDRKAACILYDVSDRAMRNMLNRVSYTHL